jgi:1-acyl-sn-glycerol-3-phosphate acyltransferase
VSESETAANPKKKQGWRHLLSRLRSYFILDMLIWMYTLVCGTLSLLCSFFDKDGKIQHNFARLWSWLILKTSLSPVTVHGIERIDTKNAQVFAANHISAMDIPVLYTQLPVPFRIVANANFFKFPFMGWHLTRSGQIPIDRTSMKSTIKSFMSAVDDLKRGLSVSIFPEGGRSQDGRVRPFFNGAFYLAVKAQVPVVPLAIVGTYEMLPMDTFHIMPNNLELWVGEPIPTEGLTTHDLADLSEKVKASIEQMYYARSEMQPEP